MYVFKTSMTGGPRNNKPSVVLTRGNCQRSVHFRHENLEKYIYSYSLRVGETRDWIPVETFSVPSRRAPRHSQKPVQGVPAFSRALNWLQPRAEHPPSSTAGLRRCWNFTTPSASLLCLRWHIMALHLPVPLDISNISFILWWAFAILKKRL
jgi:hypothetical protein